MGLRASIILTVPFTLRGFEAMRRRRADVEISNRCLTVLTRASSFAPGSDFRTGCLTVLTVASVDIQLCAATKSTSSEFRSEDHGDRLRSLVARFCTNLCPGCARATADDVQIGDFELENGRGPGI